MLTLKLKHFGESKRFAHCFCLKNDAIILNERPDVLHIQKAVESSFHKLFIKTWFFSCVWKSTLFSYTKYIQHDLGVNSSNQSLLLHKKTCYAISRLFPAKIHTRYTVFSVYILPFSNCQLC